MASWNPSEPPTWCQRTGRKINRSDAVIEEWSGLVVHRDYVMDNPPRTAPVVPDMTTHPLWRPAPPTYSVPDVDV